MKLPEHLQKSIEENKTSLGTHPAFPPEEEDTFVSVLVRQSFDSIMSQIDTTDVHEITNRLNQYITECKKEEEGCKEALEKLCTDIVYTIFEIPDDTLNIGVQLVDSCNMDKYRMVPDQTPGMQFDDIEEMNYLSDEIYKRRMVDALLVGASIYYAYDLKYYIKEIYQINPKLPELYNNIFKYNNALLFLTKDTIKNIEKSNTGKVDVNVGEESEQIIIEADGVIFPILLEQTIKGVLEVASLHGLPKSARQAQYVMMKADYRLAENWDMRLGVPLWNILIENMNECGYNIDDFGANFFIMELSQLKADLFNNYLQNAFKKTKKGIFITKEIINVIEYNKGLDDFDNFVKTNNEKHPINDGCEEYTSAELLAEAEQIGW